MKYLMISLALLSSMPLHGNCVETIPALDTFQWLEEVDSPRTLDWLQEQENRCDSYYQHIPGRGIIRNRLEQIFDYDFIDIPQKNNGKYYFFSRKKGQKQSSIYAQEEQQDPQIVIDFSDLHEEALALTSFQVSPDGTLIAYGTSKAGSDWQEWRIRDLKTGVDLPDRLTGIKFSHPQWAESGKGLYYFGFINHKAEDAYTAKLKLMYHEIGNFQDQELKIGIEDDACFYYGLSTTENDGYLIFCFTNGHSYLNGIIIKDLRDERSDFVELLPDGKAKYDYVGCLDGRLYFVTNASAERGRIISIDPQNPDSNQWIEHIPEGEGFIEQACFAGNKIVVGYLKDVSSQIYIYSPEGTLEHQVNLPKYCTASSRWRNWDLSGSKNDPEFFYPYSDFTTPVTIYRCNVDTFSTEVLAAPKVDWNPDDYEVKQIFYPSKDGTMVPLYIVHKRGLQLNGELPMLLSGYGGFGIPMTPYFLPKNILWMEMGGVYACANIRGGGEFGEAWHEAGMLQNKQNVFDDFIAAAEWLCTNGYTNPNKLAINGRSNGGLLVGACLVQKPELFKAAVIGVGVLDMLRFHKFTVGWAWVKEYGSPDDPEAYAYLYAYSPYHQIKQEVIYPSALITTGDHDNRVVPFHSYKFAAGLQAVDRVPNPILLRVYRKTGHNIGKTTNQKIEEDVDLLSFLIQELGMENFDEKLNE